MVASGSRQSCSSSSIAHTEQNDTRATGKAARTERKDTRGARRGSDQIEGGPQRRGGASERSNTSIGRGGGSGQQDSGQQQRAQARGWRQPDAPRDRGALTGELRGRGERSGGQSSLGSDRARRGRGQRPARRGGQDSGGGSHAEIRREGGRYGEGDSLSSLVGDAQDLVGGMGVQEALTLLTRLNRMEGSTPPRQWESARQLMIHVAWPAVAACRGEDLTPQQVRAVAYNMSVLGIKDEGVLRKVAERTCQAAVTERMFPFDSSTTLWALQGMQGSMSGLGWGPQQLVASFLARLDHADARDCSQFVYACHKVGWEREGDYMAVVQHFATLGSEQPHTYSLTLWAAAEHVHQPPEELGVLLAGFGAVAGGATTQALANVLLSLRKWHERSPAGILTTAFTTGADTQQVGADLIKPLVAAFCKKAAKADAQHLANVLWACAKADFVRGEQLAPVFTKFKTKAGGATPQACAYVLWAAGKLRHRDMEVVEACTARLQAVVNSSSSHDCIHSLWGLAKLEARDERACGALVQRLRQVVGDTNGEQCVSAVWALYKLGLTAERPLAQALVQRSVLQCTTLQARWCGNLMYAAGYMGVLDRNAAAALYGRFLEQPKYWTPLHVGQVLLGLWLSGFGQLPAGGEQLVQSVLPQLPRCGVADCGTLVSGLTGLLPPADPRLGAVVQQYAARALRDTAVGRSYVAKTLEQAGYRDKELIAQLRKG